MAIRGPRSDERNEDRFVLCEQELEAAFQELIWKAIQAGWDEGEACVAIASLADHHILAMQCDEETAVSIRKIRL
ncbi:hypothetical protein [Shinella sp. M27]|uniref:hypothetical protein n=1 Tax=Shinella sp. M27 TaxID=3368614 RepID=UPI003BA282E3